MSLLSLIPTTIWHAIGGAVLVLMGWAGVKVYGRAAERRGAAEALQKQETQGAQARRKADAEVARAGDADRIGELQRWER
ncbi:MAG: hypothetical protein U1E60_32125 [Reyranellaceae bacterium]